MMLPGGLNPLNSALAHLGYSQTRVGQLSTAPVFRPSKYGWAGIPTTGVGPRRHPLIPQGRLLSIPGRPVPRAKIAAGPRFPAESLQESRSRLPHRWEAGLHVPSRFDRIDSTGTGSINSPRQDRCSLWLPGRRSLCRHALPLPTYQARSASLQRLQVTSGRTEL